MYTSFRNDRKWKRPFLELPKAYSVWQGYFTVALSARRA